MLRLPVTVAAASVGLLAGLGLATFDHAEGTSYSSEDPRACVNCHIMRPQYDAWQKASHHAAATCVDCHLSATFPQKYVDKAVNGWNHSKAFTLQDHPEPIRITPPNASILQANCERCHEGLLHAIDGAAGAPECVHCHVDVGHGEPVGPGGPLREGELR